MKIYNVLETSVLIRKKPSTIYKDIARRPWSLPPRHRLPHCRALYFKDVEAWVRGDLPHMSVPSCSVISVSKRGRPSHASRFNTK